MKYLYYPGCSLKGSARAYEESLLAVFGSLGLTLEELQDWNCCGATAYMSIDEMQAFVLAARNLALAERWAGREAVSLVTPCSACFLVLTKVQRYMDEYGHLGRKVADALRDAGLRYRGDVHVRHPLDVLVNDVGLDAMTDAIVRPLDGTKVASYYGCQVARPFAPEAERYDPTSMDRVLQACGAEAVDWPLKTRCCGGTLTGTVDEPGLRLTYILLKEARERGADVLATCCPLCQFNLECYQSRVIRRFGNSASLPVVFFSQLLGRALGLDDRTLGLHRLFVPLRCTAATVERSSA